MSSAVQICNRALTTYLGVGSITALTETSPAAVQCSLHYDATRKALLESEWWFWAAKLEALAELVNDRDEWDFRYAIPAEAIDIRWVNDPITAKAQKNIENVPDIQRETYNDSIYCDLNEAYCYFTVDEDDPTKFPQYFQDALSAALAAQMAMPLTQNVQLAQNAQTQALNKLEMAISLDERRKQLNEWTFTPDYLQARGIS